ncbi:MAG: response regulator, partial [Exilibacterium sp.]
MDKVLIIDDNPAIISALEVLCEVHGIGAVKAGTPQAGLLQLAMDDEIGLVIQDMNFSTDTTSGQEGRELFYAIRESYPDLPVVLLTAW